MMDMKTVLDTLREVGPMNTKDLTYTLYGPELPYPEQQTINHVYNFLWRLQRYGLVKKTVLIHGCCTWRAAE